MRQVIALAMLAASSAAGAEDCSLPMSPLVPDGRFAGEVEMRRGREQMQAFVAKADLFLTCIEAAEKAEDQAFDTSAKKDAGLAADHKARRLELEQRYNAGVDAQKAAADKFNAQLRIWRAQNSQSGNKSG